MAETPAAVIGGRLLGAIRRRDDAASAMDATTCRKPEIGIGGVGKPKLSPFAVRQVQESQERNPGLPFHTTMRDRSFCYGFAASRVVR